MSYNSWCQEGETTFHLQSNTTTHQHLGGWHLITLMHYFPLVDVLPFRCGQIYNIVSNDEQYNVTIENFLACSCVYFVAMLATFLGSHGAYVQCKHVYHVSKTIMFYGLIKKFIHHYMWNWDEVQHLLMHSKAFEL